MVVGTTVLMMWVCVKWGERKISTWVKSQNVANLTEWTNESSFQRKLIKTDWLWGDVTLRDVERGDGIWRKTGQWHVLHPFSNTADLLNVWPPHTQNLGFPSAWEGFTSVLPLAGKSWGWSLSVSVGGTKVGQRPALHFTQPSSFQSCTKTKHL